MNGLVLILYPKLINALMGSDGARSHGNAKVAKAIVKFAQMISLA